jgi:hypothetical protein
MTEPSRSPTSIGPPLVREIVALVASLVHLPADRDALQALQVDIDRAETTMPTAHHPCDQDEALVNIQLRDTLADVSAIVRRCTPAPPASQPPRTAD